MIEYCIVRTSIEIPKNVKEDCPVCQNEALTIGNDCWYLPLNEVFPDSLLQSY